MSCNTCHVDPSGGGMRTTSGRFFGRSTLPMIATSPRPTADWDRNFPGLGRRDRNTSYNDNIPHGPRNWMWARAYADSVNDKFAWGTPPGETLYGPFQGRYDDLRADPILRFGFDARFATLLSQSTLMFPMQLDVNTRVHPIHHAVLFANVGARGRVSGYSDAVDDSHSPYFRELFVMMNELPYQLYVKAGRFVPAFGHRLDDHTNRIRREFELDGALVESRVAGFEAGIAPNYPFAQISWFKLTSKLREPDAWDIFDVDEGYGAAATGGYRAEGWSLGASVLSRWRPLDEGGDTDSYAVFATLNPWFYRRNLPITLLGEFDYGTFHRDSGQEASKLVWYAELDWLLWNGVNVLVACDFADPDRDVRDDDSARYQFGGQLIPYPGISLDGRIRYLDVATESGDGIDLILQLHLWF